MFTGCSSRLVSAFFKVKSELPPYIYLLIVADICRHAPCLSPEVVSINGDLPEGRGGLQGEHRPTGRRRVCAGVCPGSIRVKRCVRMNLNHHEEEGPNIAGFSLALYLFACIFSMMAAYEGSKFDDPRNSLAISVQSGQLTVHKNSEERRDDPFVVMRLRPERPLLRPPLALVADYQPRYLLTVRGFDARGPPAS
jgi:hypothetical protein